MLFIDEVGFLDQFGFKVEDLVDGETVDSGIAEITDEETIDGTGNVVSIHTTQNFPAEPDSPIVANVNGAEVTCFVRGDTIGKACVKFTAITSLGNRKVKTIEFVVRKC